MLKRAPDVNVDVSFVEVSSADLNADEIENDNSLFGLKEKEDTSRDCFDKNERLSHANGNLINDCSHLTIILRKL